MGPCDGAGLRGQREVRPRRRGLGDLRRGSGPRALSLLHRHMDLAPALHPADILRLHGSQRPRLGRDVPHRDQTMGGAYGCLAQPLDEESQDVKALALEIEERL